MVHVEQVLFPLKKIFRHKTQPHHETVLDELNKTFTLDW